MRGARHKHRKESPRQATTRAVEWDPGIQNFQTYITSQRHIGAQAAATGATAILSNHSEFDNAVNKNRMIAGRGNGSHPYEIGADRVQRYFQVTQRCARAARLRLEQQRTGASRR